MKQKTEEILLKHLTNHFGDGAEVYIKDHPDLIYSLHKAMVEISTEFGRWLNRDGWQEYDQENNWICQSNSNRLYTTAQLFHHFNNRIPTK